MLPATRRRRRPASSPPSAPTSRWRSIPATASPICRSPTRPMATLNADRSNAILICHALTGDQHVASDNPVTGKPGWWSLMVGPGKPIDTDRYFVICSNVVGGCMGTTGPASTNPATGRAYGLDLPVITVARHGARPGHARRPAGHRHAVLGRRRLARRHAGAAMGGELSASASSPRCRSPPAPAIPRRTSPSTRSAARR